MTTGVPIHLRRVIGRIHASSFGIDARQLPFVVIDEIDRMLFQQSGGFGFGERRTLESVAAFLGFVEGKESHWLDVIDLVMEDEKIGDWAIKNRTGWA